MKVAQSCLTLWDPMDCTVYGILQARKLEWVAVPFSRGFSQPRDWTRVSHIAGRLFTMWATRQAQEYWGGWPISSPPTQESIFFSRSFPLLGCTDIFISTQIPPLKNVSWTVLRWRTGKVRAVFWEADHLGQPQRTVQVSVQSWPEGWPWSPDPLLCCSLSVHHL